MRRAPGLAREAARKSFVLLKNEEQILPLNKTEKDSIYRTLCKHQKSDGILVDHRRGKGCNDSRGSLEVEEAGKQCGMLSGFPDAGERGDTGRIYRGNQESSYTPQEEAQMLEEALKRRRSQIRWSSVHRRRPSAVRRGNQ